MTVLAPPVAARRREALSLSAGVVAVLAVALLSLTVGAADAGLLDAIAGDERARMVFLESRIPRTLALILAGSALAIAGVVMQLLVRNRFVEPSTVGTTESALLGVLLVTLVAPAAPMPAKMGVALLAALGGTTLFLFILGRIPVRSQVVAPLVGLVLSGVIGAISAGIAYRADLTHTLSAWSAGDFSGVVRGRYEFLWLVALAAVVAFLAANAFTVAGLGEEFATSLGMNHTRIVALGMGVVALVAAATVVVAGALPFLGLVVPNLVSLVMGDYLRRSLPWVALAGAGFLLVCDIVGRVLIAPAEIPNGVITGVVGAAVFLVLLVRGSHRE